MEKVVPEPNTGCWLWMGAAGAMGHGRIWDGRRVTETHRLAWEMENGPIPDGLWILHRCDNPPCCNPGHLYAGTHQDNMRDMAQRGRGRGGGPAGERNGRARLSASDVASARERLAAGERTIVLARELGVSRKHVIAIRKGTSWVKAPASPAP